jgi:2-(1,2-epoxy-1,2-dihydrophenyl)acetyl-CoA isomerase
MTLRCDIQGSVAHIHLSRPHHRNALDVDMAYGLLALFESFQNKEDLRIIVMEGEGGHFMSGGDINLFHQLCQDRADHRQEVMEELLAVVNGVISYMVNGNQWTVGKVRGSVAGFGLSLMMACDSTWIHPDASFYFGYTDLGVSPDGGATYHLPRKVGLSRALAFAIRQSPLNTQDAQSWGLIDEVQTIESYEGHWKNYLDSILNRSFPALQATKKLFYKSGSSDLKSQLMEESISFCECVKTPEFQKNVQKFIERHK